MPLLCRPSPAAFRLPPTACRIDLRPGAGYSMGVGRLEGSPRAGAAARQARAPAQRPKKDKLVPGNPKVRRGVEEVLGDATTNH